MSCPTPLPARELERAPHLRGGRPGRGSGTRIWLARHAQVDRRWRAKAYGSQDVPLGPDGLLASEGLGSRLARAGVGALVGSDLSRAAHLARATGRAAALSAPLTPALREVDRGHWQDLPVAELHARHPEEVQAFYDDPWTFRGHGGESDADVVARAWPVLEQMIELNAGGTVALCAHYNVLRALVAEALGLEPSGSLRWRLDTACASLLVDDDSGWVLAAHNLSDPSAHDWRDEHMGPVLARGAAAH
ncbi:MAG: histidine phosphatase family protein [Planctomycetota bacterium]|jgi:broad specificity phosphatase PhoE